MRSNPGYHPGTVTRHSSPDTIAQVARALHATSHQLILIPTRGGLHRGHIGLIDTAARVPGSILVVTSLSSDNSHLDQIEHDVEVLQSLSGCPPLFFAPAWETLFPHGLRTLVTPQDPTVAVPSPPGLAESLTMHAALLSLLRPARMFVGERDFYQLVTLRHLVKDLSLPTAVTGVTTLRDSNGMAISREHTDPRMAPALALSAALVAGAHAVRDGAAGVLAAAEAVLASEPGLSHQQVVLTNYDLGPAPAEGDARLLVSACLADGTYCHDNIGLLLGTSQE
ncbi:pantoate--beta-alanine ligase [Lawsonella clevelandensis]|uniref:pantoate--beta-alanine ligase (AMP-forming) n=1 Tax=Lawsonella clevelandensis TaxID=1528099 RepID=A0A5E3ZZ16_9ACTN|nr:pantoate--beta-alanine ligase [Lawsonella clevelandensis]MDU7193281.1 pantoate--beta-alanine ligase [Lawsonella clevelandensis]VHO01128.1 Pantothenate synthetase [Lawsonella clevelandensis]